MIQDTNIAALFDLDGVVLDTEGQYTDIWRQIGQTYTDIPQFELKIKGMTLTQILAHFPSQQVRDEIEQILFQKEQHMSYPYINGVEAFLHSLRTAGVKTAVVTSSNNDKMQNVYRAHPEFHSYFDAILTANDFTKSKPSPDCYLMAADRLHTPISRCVVFEDSKNGLISGKSALMKVVGLVTTNPRHVVELLSDVAIADFSGFTLADVQRLL